MRVLITGHLGFIGTVMMPLVQKAGHEVAGLDIGQIKRCLSAGELDGALRQKAA